MLTDLLSTNNNETYNCKLASIIGLKEAIYVQQLVNIDERANRKDKLDAGGFFKVDRDYILRRTTIQEKEQREIDTKLSSIGVLDISSDQSKDFLKVNLDCVTAMFVAENEKLLGKLKTPQTKRTKQEVIKETLKNSITNCSKERYIAYCAWIDAVYDKEGWMSKEAVTSGQTTINTYCSGKEDIALRIIQIATINGYRDMMWAVNSLKKDYEMQKKQGTNMRISQVPVETTVSAGFGAEEF